jgi:hypothetical protein
MNKEACQLLRGNQNKLSRQFILSQLHKDWILEIYRIWFVVEVVKSEM